MKKEKIIEPKLYGKKFSTRTKMECLECGKVFWKNVGYGTVEAKCPKCGGYDTNIVGLSGLM